MQATIKRAQQLRSNLTNAEQLLWRHLRMRQINGYKFRRQRLMGPFIVDFICLEKQLIVELDGGQHAEQKRYDSQRDAWLRSQRYDVLRFWDHEIFNNIESIKEAILRALNGPPPVSSPEAGQE